MHACPCSRVLKFRTNESTLSAHAAGTDHLGESFLRVEPGNAQQFADRLATALGDSGLRSAFAQKLQRHAAEHLSWESVAACTLEAYAAAVRAGNLPQALAGV
jgi:hypothetical protein